MTKKSIATTVDTWIRKATNELAVLDVPSALLDAELILAHTLRHSRTWLHAHGEDEISPHLLEIAAARLDLRKDHVPVAYIIGHKEFYGRRFHVTPATLVPRPESETIISMLGQLTEPTHLALLDVGTGSGCLGITAKLEYPEISVTLSDISKDALTVARKNASALHADVNFIESDLLGNISGTFDIILANLPYVDKNWDTSPDIAHEPALALFAEDKGLALIKKLLAQAHVRLSTQGYVILEADPCQHAEITSFAQNLGYAHKATTNYIVVLSRD